MKKTMIAEQPVRPLRRDELRRAAVTLALAFDEDPIFQFLLGTDARKRQTLLRWFHQSALNECFRFGGALTLEDGPESGVVGIIPPGHWPVPIYRTLASVTIPRALPTLHLIRWGLHIEDRIRSLHPAERHLYVYVLGVHPTLKGKGLGATLMRHVKALAKDDGCVMHLETSNPVNLPFYRRFDLEVATEIVSHRGPPIWTMTTPA